MKRKYVRRKGLNGISPAPTKQELANQIYPPKPRSTKDINDEYTQTAFQAGDTQFKMELERGKLQQLNMRLGKLRDEFIQATEYEKKHPPSPPPAPAEHRLPNMEHTPVGNA